MTGHGTGAPRFYDASYQLEASLNLVQTSEEADAKEAY